MWLGVTPLRVRDKAVCVRVDCVVTRVLFLFVRVCYLLVLRQRASVCIYNSELSSVLFEV